MIEKEIKLPCGVSLKNRLAKSAMSENLASGGLPREKMERLYETWGSGGLGLIITGNVMVDGDELGEPNNVVLEDAQNLPVFRAWTDAAKKEGSAIWAQINHPGRQAPAAISKVTVAPSAIKLKVGSIAFRTPHALTESEIRQVIEKYATTARLCKEAGFDGVQIHGAHGYLVSQFLSPLSNVRTDLWGGTIENRSRFPLEILRAIRRSVGVNFPIGMKINSADFQRGGFNEEDAAYVVQALEAEGIDLIEISGGTYESAAMVGAQEVPDGTTDTMSSLLSRGAQDVLKFSTGTACTEPVEVTSSSTAQREAYFLPFAKHIRSTVKIPLMLTGGFRSTQAMEEALESGAIDIVGLARPLAMEPHLAKRLLSDKRASIHVKPVKTGIAALDKMGALEIGYYSLQLKRLGEGKAADPELSPLLALPLLGINYTQGFLERLLKRSRSA